MGEPVYDPRDVPPVVDFDENGKPLTGRPAVWPAPGIRERLCRPPLEEVLPHEERTVALIGGDRVIISVTTSLGYREAFVARLIDPRDPDANLSDLVAAVIDRLKPSPIR